MTRITLEDALRLGVKAQQARNFAEAERYYSAVLAALPNHADANHNMGILRVELGRWGEALPLFQRAIEANPNKEYYWMNYVGVLSVNNRLKDAQNIIRSAKKSGLPQDFINKLQNILRSNQPKGNAKDPESAVKELIELYNKGNLKEVVERAEVLTKQFPKVFVIWNVLGAAATKLGKLDQAISAFKKAITLNPQHHEAYNNMGNTLSAQGKLDEAIKAFNKAISLKPDYIEAYNNLGVAFRTQGKLDKAIEIYDKILTLKPDFAGAWYNRGNVLSETKQFERALASFDKAISFKSGSNSAYRNKSSAQLVTGDLQGGWSNYEYRWLTDTAKVKEHQQFPDLANLNDLKSSTVLVWWEQGYGDTIQFSRYVPLLKELGANVVFDVQKPLKSLLQHSFPGIKFITRDEPVSGIDFQVPVMSLPRLFSTDLTNIPSSQGYLKPVPESIDLWRGKLNLNSSKPNIGIACSGNEAQANDKNRSMALSFFEPLLDVANLFLIQKDIRDSDKDFLSHHPEIKFLGDQISTFEDSASIIELMDQIVTVDTSLVHLSGALGKSAKVLLTWNACWRWLLDRQDSPWYHSIQVFRQPNPGDWKSVINSCVLSEPTATGLTIVK